MQVNRIQNNNNSTSFGKVLKFENQYSEIFDFMYGAGVYRKIAFADLLDTFVNSKIMKQLVAEKDVNIKFEKLHKPENNMRFSVAPATKKDFPYYWEAEASGNDDFDVLRKIAKDPILSYDTTPKRGNDVANLVAKWEEKLGTIIDPSSITQKLDVQNKLVKKIQDLINSILNM